MVGCEGYVSKIPITVAAYLFFAFLFSIPLPRNYYTYI